MSRRLTVWFAVAFTVVSSLLHFSMQAAYAHGERAQMASLRMRTVHWFDTEIYPREVKVNDIVTVKGRFSPSEWWPDNIASIEHSAFLNIGVPGPSFIRVSSEVNGVPMIRSTRFEFGKVYEYEIKLKARAPGKYHVHPVISVESAGPIIGPAFWVEVKGNQADFKNTVTTLTHQTLDLEHYGMSTIVWWNALWFVLGAIWIAWWFRKLPSIMPRFIKVQELGEDANKLITIPDMVFSFLMFGVVMVIIAAGFLWTQYKYPITTPLQTGKVDVAGLPLPPKRVSVEVEDATYRIPGRSFQLHLAITNHTDKPVQVGEFNAANIRFINPKILNVKPNDKDDLVASQGLIVEDPPVQPGETRVVTIYADDALWETYRLTSLIYEPDSRFAGMLFLYDTDGRRYFQEIGGPMIPTFT